MPQIVLATTSSFGGSAPQAAEALSKAGYRLVTNPYGRKLTEAELQALLAEHKPVGLLAGTEPIGPETLSGAADHLKALARVGVGWDNVPHEKAAELGIPVSRTEGVLNQAVAELALGFTLSALRNIPSQDRDIREGTWEKGMGRLFSGKTLGIVGMGAIGRRLAELAEPFGVKIIFCDVGDISGTCGEQCDMDRLLTEADIISLHVSGSECLLGRAELERMKPGSIVVNTARGGLIDEDALAELLGSGHIGAACLDVFAKEPYSGPLASQKNAILSPHIGSYAAEARAAMEIKAVDNLLADLKKQGA